MNEKVVDDVANDFKKVLCSCQEDHCLACIIAGLNFLCDAVQWLDGINSSLKAKPESDDTESDVTESNATENAHVAVDTCGDSVPTVNSVDTDTLLLAPEPPCESLVSSGSPAMPLLGDGGCQELTLHNGTQFSLDRCWKLGRFWVRTLLLVSPLTTETPNYQSQASTESQVNGRMGVPGSAHSGM